VEHEVIILLLLGLVLIVLILPPPILLLLPRIIIVILLLITIIVRRRAFPRGTARVHHQHVAGLRHCEGIHEQRPFSTCQHEARTSEVAGQVHPSQRQTIAAAAAPYA
jgi:hypothetical protein